MVMDLDQGRSIIDEFPCLLRVTEVGVFDFASGKDGVWRPLGK